MHKMPSCFRIAAAVVALTAVLLAGCSKDSSADLSDLLSTVPAEADAVITFDLGNLVRKAGCKVEDGKIELSEALTSAVAGIKDPEAKKMLSDMVGGKSGVELTSVVIFTQGYRTYMTGLLSDPDAFRKFTESREAGSGFSDRDGISCSRTAAVKGNQFWIVSAGDLDPLDVKVFATLQESKSFSAGESADLILGSKDDVCGLVSVSSPLIGFSDMATQMQAQMALQSLFDDAAFFDFGVSFGKGKMTGRARVLDGKLKPARSNLPLGKVDGSTVKLLGGSGDSGLAIGLPAKAVEKIGALLAKTGGIGKLYQEIIAPVDGTVTFMIGSDSGDGSVPPLEGVIATRGNGLSALASAADQFGLKWRMDGSNMILSSEVKPQGQITPDMLAKESAGTVVAYMAGPKALQSRIGATSLPVSTLALRLKPSGGSLEAEIEVKGKSDDQQILAAFLTEMFRR